ncbi:PREDICTED: vitamin K epoxide reductase complex subunit 1 [Ceratosolen solmsi marchali]|uniref:vitamin-K-epoxide reductase (warfarin-sensitive) n=1 Tax=Ceratosolen solmsi marchali TaxID=326594 RepID=A0AAJ6YLC5_9HYME|nr:PREDICTED: vitamin K epoxide reductase complex subunit 1 [Ceratosolen solmsi marchali]
MATYSMQRLDAVLLWLCLQGVAICYYAYVVETNKVKDKEYQPLCDVNEYVSCSKAFMSEYGKGFGLIPKDSPFHLPNSIFGIIYYTLVASLSLFNNYWNTALMLIMSVIWALFSIYLARILYLLQSICLVCISTYILNALIMILSIKKIREINQVSSKKRKTN